MAYADYRLCDVCGGKAFYDAGLNYDFDPDEDWSDDQKAQGFKLDYLGDWAVLCNGCAKTHTCVIVPKEGA